VADFGFVDLSAVFWARKGRWRRIDRTWYCMLDGLLAL
jgi:hypothetical protein